MNRLLIVIILGILSTASVLARETVKGTVVDAKGEPIPGVRVEVPGNSEFVFTDLDGMFQIILREPTKNLKFSYPGYSPATYKVKPEMTVVIGKGWAGHEKGSRSMIDLEGGIGFNGKATFISEDCEARDLQTLVLTGMSFTLGRQINRHLFIGGGFGTYLDLTRYEELEHYNNYYSNWKYTDLTGVYASLFVAARWDFGLTRKTAPYIGLKAGYMQYIPITDYDLCYAYGSSSRIIVNGGLCGSFFISPSIGYRITLHNKFGMNLGISYMAGMKKKFNVEEYSRNTTTEFVFKQRTSDAILFNIGFDI